MKRMIACEVCSKRPPPKYEGEWFERVYGKARKNMLCDWCCPPTEIKAGDKCAAESLGVDGHSIYYGEWEHEFLIEDEKQ